MVDSKSNTKEQKKTALGSVFNILAESINFYKEKLNSILGIMVIPFLANLIIGLAGLRFFPNLSVESWDLDQISISALGLLSILVIINILISIWAQVALIILVKDKEKDISIGEAFSDALDKILSYIWVSVLVFLAVLGGIILLVIPGVIFAVWFSLATYILVVEGLKGREALKKSREYVTGHWGAVFWRILFLGILGILVMLFFTTLVVGLLGLWGLETGSISIVTNIANDLLVSLVFIPIGVIYMFLLYSQLRDLKSSK